MAFEIPCPSCGRPINPQNRYCEHCGVDLAVAAAIAEQAVAIPTNLKRSVPIAPEALVPRIGDYLIEQGLLSHEGLHQGLNLQNESAASGKSILLGQALLELNLISRETLDQAVTMQILKLQKALSMSNQQLQQRVQERTQELQKALQRLSELNQLKSNFIANISHELRTPLTHIKGYLDLLNDGGLGPLTKSQADALSIVQRAEVRLERLIEDLIQFSTASRGELNLTLNTSKLDQLITTIIERATPKARSKGIQLKSMLPIELPAIRADEEKIGWVLSQLLDNSIKFTLQNGRVAISASVEGNFVQIAVTDSGIGIPQDQLLEIFEPFYQLDGSATRRYSGTGLGLAMVRRIVEAHGSQVIVKSAVGKGSRFEFNLPIARPVNQSG